MKERLWPFFDSFALAKFLVQHLKPWLVGTRWNASRRYKCPVPSPPHRVTVITSSFFLQVNLTWTSLIITRKNFILHPKALSFTQTETPINWQTLIANYSPGFEKSWNQFKTTTRNFSLKKMRQDLFAPFWLALITHSLPFTLFQLLY